MCRVLWQARLVDTPCRLPRHGVQELMQQASWNLCPAGDSSGCYWSIDQTFEQLAGRMSVVVPDVPDGGL